MPRMWIGGEWTGSASRRAFAVSNPATEAVLDEVPRADARDADRAVRAAAETFKTWRTTPGLERANPMHQFATVLRQKHHAIARQMTLEGGKPLIENIDEIEWCIAHDQAGKVLAPVFPHQVNFVRKEPLSAPSDPLRVWSVGPQESAARPSATTLSRRLSSKGFLMKSNAPRSSDLSAVSSSEMPLIMMTIVLGNSIFSRRRVSLPSIPGIATSRKMTSKLRWCARANACAPLWASDTSWPRTVRKSTRT